MKKFFLIPLFACLTCVMALAENAEKFFLGVTSNQTIGAYVYEGLNLKLEIPASGTMYLEPVTVAMRMQQVPALGVTDLRSQTVTLHPDLGTVDMLSWLGSAYNFGGAKLVVSVKADGATQSFLLSFGKCENGVIEAHPHNEGDARAAWNLFGNQFDAGTKDVEDSYILIKAGSYIQFGGKMLKFKSDFEAFKGDWQSAGGLEAIAGKLANNAYTEYEANGKSDNIMYIAAGSEFALGQSIAKSSENVTITLAGNTASSDALSLMHGGSVNDAIKGLVTFGNDFLGLIDGADVKYLTINVGDQGELEPEEAEIPDMGTLALIRDGLTPGNYYTACLKNGVNSYTGATFYEIEYLDANEGRLVLVSVNSLEAGMPYVYIPSATVVKGYFNDNESDEAKNKNGLYGTFKSIRLEYNAGYYAFGDNGFGKIADDFILAPNRAYVKFSEVPTAPSAAPGRRHVISVSQVATGIDGVEFEDMSAEGVKKAIIDGQLVIIRDGVKYNAQGAVME